MIEQLKQLYEVNREILIMLGILISAGVGYSLIEWAFRGPAVREGPRDGSIGLMNGPAHGREIPDDGVRHIRVVSEKDGTTHMYEVGCCRKYAYYRGEVEP